MSNVAFIAEPKAAFDVLDYGFDYTAWLAGDTITTSVWTVPSGIVEDSETETTSSTTIWLSSGTACTTYTITNQITTTAGRSKELTFLVPVV